MPWLPDSPSRLGIEALDITIELWLEDRQTAEALAQAQWFQDGIARRDLETIQHFAALASRNPAVARKVAEGSWFRESVSHGERRLLDLLGPDEPSPSFLDNPPEYLGTFSNELVLFFMHSQVSLSTEAPTAGLLEQPWVFDGLSPIELAFAVAIGGVAFENPLLYRDLLRERYAATRATSFPLTGEVSIYVFQNTPIDDDAGILDRIELTARKLESLLEVPFPATEIILVVGDATAVDYSIYRGSHYGSHMFLTRYRQGVASIAHEVAHYYFATEPRWFVEGAAEFAELYVDDAVDVAVYARREDAPPHHALGCLIEDNAQNLRHFLALQHEDGRTLGICTYSLGEWFLVHLYDSIGEEAFGSALGSWHLQQEPLLKRVAKLVEGPRLVDPASIPNPERVTFNALLEGIPEGMRGRFEQLYLEKHGGMGGGPDDGIPDDFGDGTESASIIATGESIAGSLEHAFDFDYFRFQAVAGRKYELDFEHRTRTSSVAIYDIPSSRVYHGSHFYELFGEVLARVSPVSMELARHRLWIAPRSGDFYLAVQNFGGAPGPYTLSISSLEESPDDHGDNRETATDVLIGKVVEGTLVDAWDFDYFRLQPEGGRSYQVDVVANDGQRFLLWFFDSEGRNVHGTGNCFETQSGSVSVQLPYRGQEAIYAVVSGPKENDVAYTLLVTERDG